MATMSLGMCAYGNTFLYELGSWMETLFFSYPMTVVENRMCSLLAIDQIRNK
jgi:hypothetical protein